MGAGEETDLPFVPGSSREKMRAGVGMPERMKLRALLGGHPRPALGKLGLT